MNVVRRAILIYTPSILVAVGVGFFPDRSHAAALWPAREIMEVGGIFLLLITFVVWLTVHQWTAKRKVEKTIRHSEARFRALLEAAPDAVIVTNERAEIVFVNMQTERLFGYRPDQLIGQPIEILVPARFHKEHVGHRNGYIAAPQVRPMGKGRYLYGARCDGTEFPVEISLSPVEIDQGKMIFCDVRDMTNQRLAEQQIRELNERLKRDNAELETVNRELEAFSYSVSHDLRAPLRAIDGFSQALLEDHVSLLDDAGRSYLERVRQAAQRMGLLIDDLIKLAGVTRGEITFDEVDLSALVNGIGRRLVESNPERQARIIVPADIRARGDTRMLRIAVENLLDNAWKFTAGRNVAEIEFGRLLQNGAPVYFVRDNGVGFDMTYAGKLFGAFQRLHDNGAFPGTGIGLATVQRIIHKHSGRIWAEAAVDKGAAFYFTL